MLRPVAYRPLPFFRFSPSRCVTVLVALLAGGCSADFTRLDSPSFQFEDGPANASDPIPSAPVRRNVGGPIGEDATLADARVPPLRYGPATPVAVPRRLPPVQDAEPRRPAVPAQYRPSSPSAPPVRQPQPIAKTETIEVQPGDTIYGLSKRHRVTIAGIMSVNDLRNPTIKPGQKLYLPAKQPDLPAEEAPPPARVASAREPVETTASLHPRNAPAAAVEGAYTVKPGDNLYGIARAHRVTVAELQTANGITNVRNMKPGMVLKLPPAGAAPVVATAPTPSLPAPRSAQAEVPPLPVQSQEPKREAALRLPDRASDVAAGDAPVPPLVRPAPVERPAPPPQSASLRWPARGRIVSAFGARPDGTHNDGINVAVPLGTDVHAAESGSVHYAGSELKSYGNLVLIKHDNGWVTAYAHNDQILVKRGDRVQRGQVIGRAGKSGNVDQPQIHFELRHDAKPVDPMPHLERL